MEGSGGVAEDATGTQQDETEMKISIKASAGGQRETQTVTASMSVAALKGDLEEAFGCRAQQMRLIYKGRVLQDANTLGSYGLQAEHTVHLVKSPTVPPSDKTQQGTGAAPTATAAGGGGGGTNSQARAAAPTQTGAAQGGSGAYHNDMAPDPGPAAMREMLGSPMFQNIMDNPDTIRGIITSNPQLRELVDRNPELAHVLNDPSTLRQAMDMVRNPELMREQMRSTDRAMANMEGHPEGFNMLRRMYENVQEPLMNATDRREDRNNPFASLFAEGGALPEAPIPSGGTPNTDPLPNPWASRNDAAAGGGNAGGVPAPAPAGGMGGFLGGAGGGGGANPFAGMGVDFPGAGGGTDQEAMMQMLENPATRGMVQRMLSDPSIVESMMAANPQFREMMRANPQLMQMMQNPQLMEMMSDPNTMRSLLNVQREMERQPNLGALFGMMGGGAGGVGTAAAPPAPVQDPARVYARQLQQLQEMGFFDTDANIRALQAVHGNVNAAVERLLSGL